MDVPDRVPNDALRLAFQASGLSAYQLALDAGVTRKFTMKRSNGETIGRRVGGDATAALRDLGLKPHPTGQKGGHCKRRSIRRDKALAYAKAIGIDPVDIGL